MRIKLTEFWSSWPAGSVIEVRDELAARLLNDKKAVVVKKKRETAAVAPSERAVPAKPRKRKRAKRKPRPIPQVEDNPGGASEP